MAFRWKHPTGQDPRSVDLVALGPTSRDWTQRQLFKSPQRQLDVADEVWTLNRGIRAFPHDMAFVMDDLLTEGLDDPEYDIALKAHHKPIITSTAYLDEYGQSLPYPLAEVLRYAGIKRAYFHNSVPYVIAYAMMIGVQRLTLWGCDYTYPGLPIREDDRANCEYWVGVAEARGMSVLCPRNSTLLNSVQKQETWFYGYSRQPREAWNNYLEPLEDDVRHSDSDGNTI